MHPFDVCCYLATPKKYYHTFNIKQINKSGDDKYVLYVTSVKDSVEEARKDVYSILKEKIFIPKMFYRNDIGLKFIEQDHALLKKWGYLK